MEFWERVMVQLCVWLTVFGIMFVFKALYRWARKRKGAALAFGLLVQMFLPDPKVQQTIEIVTESKQKVKKSSQQAQSDIKSEQDDS